MTNYPSLEALAAEMVATDPVVDMTTVVMTWMADAARLHPAEWKLFEQQAARAQAVKVLGQAMINERRALSRQAQRAITEQRAENLIETGTIGDAHYAVGNHQWKRLSVMTRTELEATATHIECIANGELRRAALIRALAKRLPTPDTTLTDIYTPEQIEAMFRGLDPLTDAA